MSYISRALPSIATIQCFVRMTTVSNKDGVCASPGECPFGEDPLRGAWIDVPIRPTVEIAFLGDGFVKRILALGGDLKTGLALYETKPSAYAVHLGNAVADRSPCRNWRTLVANHEHGFERFRTRTD